MTAAHEPVRVEGDRIVASGELDASNIAQLRSALREHPEASKLDLSMVTFMDSTVLRDVVLAHRDGRIRIVGTSRNVRRLFEITDLEHLLDQ